MQFSVIMFRTEEKVKYFSICFQLILSPHQITGTVIYLLPITGWVPYGKGLWSTPLPTVRAVTK